MDHVALWLQSTDERAWFFFDVWGGRGLRWKSRRSITWLIGLPTDFIYGGNGTGVIISSRTPCISGLPSKNWFDKISTRDVTDGLSNTLLAGEMHVPQQRLRQSPGDAFIFNGDHLFNTARVGGPTVPIESDIHAEGNSLVGWGSFHRGICHFAMADGSTRSLSSSTDTDILGRLANRSEGEIASPLD